MDQDRDKATKAELEVCNMHACFTLGVTKKSSFSFLQVYEGERLPQEKALADQIFGEEEVGGWLLL